MVPQHNPQAADALLTLDDDALLAFDDEQAVSLGLRALRLDFLGIRIQGPARLDIDAHEELPILLLSRTTALRNWQVEPRRNMVLVGVDRGTGIVRTAWAFPTHKRINVESIPRSMRGNTPGPEASQDLSAKARILKGREALDLPWVASELSFTVICYDWVSNTARTALVSRYEEPLAPHPEEEARSLVEELGDRLEWFRRGADSPALAGQGAVLKVPSSASAEAPEFLVRGTLRIPVPAGCIVASGGAEEGLPEVVLRVTLLLVKRDELSPGQVELELPVFTGRKVAPGDEVEGFFALDLYALGAREQLLDGDTLLYLIAGDHVVGPYAVEVRP